MRIAAGPPIAENFIAEDEARADHDRAEGWPLFVDLRCAGPPGATSATAIGSSEGHAVHAALSRTRMAGTGLEDSYWTTDFADDTDEGMQPTQRCETILPR
jgi:hypothetical protein